MISEKLLTRGIDLVNDESLEILGKTGTNSSGEQILIPPDVESSAENVVTVVPTKVDEGINHNKPWRVVSRRKVTDGGSDNENIS